VLKRFSAVILAVSQPFLGRFWAENGGKLGRFGLQKDHFWRFTT
jgi:hypothetical protein